MNRRKLFATFTDSKSSSSSSGSVSLFSNPTLRTHENKQVRFYDDLVKGKQFVVNLMYANCEGVCPAITANLIRVHKALKHRMGKDLFMYSITLKPEQDDPAALKHFAEMHGAANLPGWSFLTGDPYDIETIRFKLFRWDHIKFDLDVDTHTGMLRIINEENRQWTMCSPRASLFTILQHISWVEPQKSFAERLEENKRTQEKIDKEVKTYGYRRTT